MAMQKWVRLPSSWIDDGGLKDFTWKNGGSDNVSALMTLIAIAHRADQQTGIARLTYEDICDATEISRAKISRGLSILEELEIIDRWSQGRSTFELVDFNPAEGWCMLPAGTLYSGKVIEAFRHFHLRNKVELNALRLYLLFAARRGRDTNLANISFEKITEYSGVRQHDIKAATSLLAAVSLAYIERTPSNASEFGVANAYRLVGLDSTKHMGTRGRRMDTMDYFMR